MLHNVCAGMIQVDMLCYTFNMCCVVLCSGQALPEKLATLADSCMVLPCIDRFLHGVTTVNSLSTPDYFQQMARDVISCCWNDHKIGII